MNQLVGVFMKFRVGRFALCADIEAFFHQVRVPKLDADSLRFLWTDDIHSNAPPYTMQMLVHIFGAKDSATCAIHALRQTARDNHLDFDALTYETILKCFYVDDLLKSLNDEKQLSQLANELIEICRRGGFRLTKFLSNSKLLTDALPPEEVSPNVSVDIDTEHLERTLGTLWNVTDDVITYSSSLKEGPTTKRGIMGTTCSLFDLIGFLSPFILIPKMLLQELWRLGYDWDSPVDDNILAVWIKWLEGVKRVPEIKLDRCYNRSDEPVTEVQLHLFCDASERAYGAVAYLRFCYKSGGFHCSFVISKSKVAPIKTVTLPRLELCSAVASVRLYRTVIHELDVPIERIYFWADSQLTLQYINNKAHRFRVFVANRTTEILEHSQPEQWRHIPGKVNPADLLTRGVNDPTDLLQTNKEGTSWLFGPQVLYEVDDSWPSSNVEELDSNNPEIKPRNCMFTLLQMDEDQTIDANRFSTWTSLQRSIAWVFRFAANSRTTINQRNFAEVLSYDELRRAIDFIIQDMQRVHYQDEFRIIREGQRFPKGHKLTSLCPFVDGKGMLRVGGRLKNAPIPDASKHQIIIPQTHPITKLIIREEHKCNGHIGVEHVLSNLREIFWIIGGRTAIRSVIRKCFFCQVRRAVSMYPYMADLPEGRLAYDEPPFTNCGVDLFGPLFVKQGRKRLKRWAVLFTCLTVRCVHLEKVESPDTDSFINALRCFINRRGRPQIMYSDCGTNFVGATTELQELISGLNREQIENFATKHSIRWSFNPPASPHMGGAWERLVRSVKEVMTGLMHDRVLTDPQLYTLLTEVESILNTRPLTRASDDVNDLEALTPNHILIGRHRNWTYMADNINEKDVSSRKRWRQVQALGGIFWQRWKQEYLPTLTKRPKGTDHVPNLKVDDLVLVSDTETKRRKWPLGRITRVMPGEDGVVRVAEVKTKDGVYTRPVVKLYRLEDDLE